MKKKLYIVKKEVFATSIEKAATAKGHVFAIELAADAFQPENKKSPGFKK